MARKHRFQHRKKKDREKRLAKVAKLNVHGMQASNESSESSIERSQLTPLQTLYATLVTEPQLLNEWSNQSKMDESKIVLCKLVSGGNGAQRMVVTHALTIMENLLWILYVFQHRVDRLMCNPLKSFPAVLHVVDHNNLFQLLAALDKLSICVGHHDEQFIKMIVAKKQKLLSKKGEVVAVLDKMEFESNGKLYSQTIRSTSCEILCDGQATRCTQCKSYRSILRAIYYKWSRRPSYDPSTSTKFMNERYLSTPETRAKIASLRERANKAEQAVSKLREKIQQLTQEHGEMVDGSLQSDLLQIMHEKTDIVKNMYPEGSFARLFWEEQLKAATISAKQVRWHPVIIKWCLNLKLMCSSAYHALRSSGFIKLPSERTLRDYTHYFKNICGFLIEVDKQLLDEANLTTIPESRRYISLVIDEMKIKEGLVYNKYSGEIIGLTNEGDINDDLLRLEQTAGEHPPIAK